jgi:hypothetical protein
LTISAATAASAATTDSARPSSTLETRLPTSSIPENAFLIVSTDTAGSDPYYCLDAQDSGSLAGKDGDTVQLWHCNYTPNQYWYVGSTDSAGNSTLVNAAYPSECLNAKDAGGLFSGQPLQLWHCSVNTSNEYWDAPYWEGLSGAYPYHAELALEADNYNFVLDARSPGIGNGDKVQIYTFNGGPQQEWYPSFYS